MILCSPSSRSACSNDGGNHRRWIYELLQLYTKSTLHLTAAVGLITSQQYIPRFYFNLLLWVLVNVQNQLSSSTDLNRQLDLPITRNSHATQKKHIYYFGTPLGHTAPDAVKQFDDIFLQELLTAQQRFLFCRTLNVGVAQFHWSVYDSTSTAISLTNPNGIFRKPSDTPASRLFALYLLTS
jgi:hypothetical protein